MLLLFGYCWTWWWWCNCSSKHTGFDPVCLCYMSVWVLLNLCNINTKMHNDQKCYIKKYTILHNWQFCLVQHISNIKEFLLHQFCQLVIMKRFDKLGELQIFRMEKENVRINAKSFHLFHVVRVWVKLYIIKLLEQATFISCRN